MPSDLENYQTIKSQTLTTIAQITATPKPSYSIDGQSISWNDYLQKLQQLVAWCDQQIQACEPFEIHTRGCTP